MNEDPILEPKRQGTEPPANLPTEEVTQDNPAERVFDISEDSITPIKDEPAPPAPPPARPQAQPPAQSQKAIPLQDFSAPLAKAKDVNAGMVNPPPPPPPTPPSPPPQAEPVPPITTTGNAPPQKAIRTYESDVAEVLARKKASTASIALAESRRNEESDTIKNKAQPSRAPAKLLITLVSLVLVAGGLAGAYYLYLQSPLAPVTPYQEPPRTAASLVPSDEQSTIAVDRLGPIDIMTVIQNEISLPQAPNTIKELVVIENNLAGRTIRVTGPEMTEKLDIDAPGVLNRSLTPPWMLGVYTNPAGEKSVFVVATTDFFQNAFAGMLQWEAVMADDLRQYLFPVVPMGVSNIGNEPQPIDRPLAMKPIESSLPGATSTATSAPALAVSATSTASSTSPEIPPVPYATISGRFEDRIVKNKDVREFRAADGKIVFLYSFIDQTKLVVTASEETLAEIISRLERQAFIR